MSMHEDVIQACNLNKHRHSRVGCGLNWRVVVRSLLGVGAEQANFSALPKRINNVSFNLKRGECLGVLGLNGAGKTTLLKVLSGNIPLDSGQLYLKDKPCILMDLTSGFKAEESAHENIFIKCASLGISKKEVEEKLDEIIDFSELSEFMGIPICEFSQGMKLRLAFSIAVSFDSSIYLIDEVLSVGDFTFRQKCLAKMREKKVDSSFVLVSHSMSDIRGFCDEVMVMHKGEIAYRGAPEDAITFYQGLKNESDKPSEIRKAKILEPEFHNPDAVVSVSARWVSKDGKELKSFCGVGALTLEICFTTLIEIQKLTLGVPVWDDKGVYVTGFSTEISGENYSLQPGEHKFYLEVENAPFNPGVYYSNLTILAGAEFLFRKPLPELEVAGSDSRYWGVVTLPHLWRRV